MLDERITDVNAPVVVRVRLQIIRNARIKTVGKYQSCMVVKLQMILKRTCSSSGRSGGRGHQPHGGVLILLQGMHDRRARGTCHQTVAVAHR